MEEVLLMTGMFVVGAGAGALISHAHDRSLLSLYGHLVADLRRMIPHDGPEDPGPPEPPAVAARITELPPLVEAQRKAAS